MKAVTQLVGLVVALRPTLTSDHDARRGHPGEAGEADQFPAHAHQQRRVVP